MDFARVKKVWEAEGVKKLEGIKPGQFVYIEEKIGDRVWRFKGIVIKVHNPSHADGTFTVRGEVAGVKVEKIYPFSFPNFKKVEVLDEYKVRRAKLYYLREKIGRQARLRSKKGAAKGKVLTQ